MRTRDETSDLPTDEPSGGDGGTPPRGDRGRTIALPPRMPRRLYRPTQPNIPSRKAVRDRLKRAAALHVEQEGLVPPLSAEELLAEAEKVCKSAGVELTYRDFTAIIVNNEAWRDTLARIPYDRRLLLLPQCLRADDRCSAPIDEFGLVCQDCGLCSIHYLKEEAERLGYGVLVAEGSAVVMKLIETGQIEAVVGVSCMDVLEKCFPHMEARAVPGAAVPLLQDGCANTSVDLDWVWDVIHLTSDDRSHRLDLDALKHEVRSSFNTDALGAVIGSPEDETERIAHDWLARAGKRWRPYLTTCVYVSLQGQACDCAPPLPEDLKKLAIAVECFHKASLIHDDIEDDDHERYGQQALHVEHGMPVALNVGDFLLGQGYRLISELEVDDRTKVAMLRTAAAGHLTLSRGQGAELCWDRQPEPLSSLAVLDIFRQKTAPAFEVALRLGAFYGQADRAVHEVLRRYSESLGIAYQIRDDIEDYTGRGDSNDLQDVRPSVVLAIAHHRAAAGRETDLIASFWSRTRTYDEVADEVQYVIAERGVIDTAQNLLDSYTAQATRALQPLKNATLKGLLRRVVGKIFGEDQIEGYCRELEARNAAGGQVRAEPAA